MILGMALDILVHGVTLILEIGVMIVGLISLLYILMIIKIRERGN